MHLIFNASFANSTIINLFQVAGVLGFGSYPGLISHICNYSICFQDIQFTHSSHIRAALFVSEALFINVNDLV